MKLREAAHLQQSRRHATVKATSCRNDNQFVTAGCVPAMLCWRSILITFDIAPTALDEADVVNVICQNDVDRDSEMCRRPQPIAVCWVMLPEIKMQSRNSEVPAVTLALAHRSLGYRVAIALRDSSTPREVHYVVDHRPESCQVASGGSWARTCLPGTIRTFRFFGESVRRAGIKCRLSEEAQVRGEPKNATNLRSS